jgi:hypothetical protein
MRYRCYFLDLQCKIAWVEILEADTDADADALSRGDFSEALVGNDRRRFDKLRSHRGPSTQKVERVSLSSLNE